MKYQSDSWRRCCFLHCHAQQETFQHRRPGHQFSLRLQGEDFNRNLSRRVTGRSGHRHLLHCSIRQAWTQYGEVFPNLIAASQALGMECWLDGPWSLSRYRLLAHQWHKESRRQTETGSSCSMQSRSLSYDQQHCWRHWGSGG